METLSLTRFEISDQEGEFNLLAPKERQLNISFIISPKPKTVRSSFILDLERFAVENDENPFNLAERMEKYFEKRGSSQYSDIKAFRAWLKENEGAVWKVWLTGVMDRKSRRIERLQKDLESFKAQYEDLILSMSI